MHRSLLRTRNKLFPQLSWPVRSLISIRVVEGTVAMEIHLSWVDQIRFYDIRDDLSNVVNVS